MNKRRLGMLAGAVAVLVAGGAYAAIPDSQTGVISACYEKLTGVLRVIDAEAGKTCTRYEVPISWNQQGPQGIEGPEGPEGRPGPPGPPGRTGLGRPFSSVIVERGVDFQTPGGVQFGDVGRDIDIAIGADGFPLISYYDPGENDLRVAHCSNAACTEATATTLDSEGDVGTQTSIAIGADGLGLIAYHDETNRDLKVAHCANVACTSAVMSTVDSAGDVGQHASLAIGSDGRGLISYHQAPGEGSPGGALKVAHCSDAACSSATTTVLETGRENERVEGVGFVSETTGLRPSLVVGGDGLGLIAFYRRQTSPEFKQFLKIAHCDNAACTSAAIRTAVDGGGVGGSSAGTEASAIATAVGPDGLAQIAFQTVSTGGEVSLRVSGCLDAECSFFYGGGLVEAGRNLGNVFSMALDSDGVPVLAYSASNQELRVAHCFQAACNFSTTTNGPTIETVDQGFSGGYFPAIAIGRDGLPVVAYHTTDVGPDSELRGRGMVRLVR